MQLHSTTIGDPAIEGAPGTSGGGCSSTRAIMPKRSSLMRQQSWDWGFPGTEHPDPITIDGKGNRKFMLQYDVRQFRPEDITIKTLDNKLEVSVV